MYYELIIATVGASQVPKTRVWTILCPYAERSMHEDKNVIIDMLSWKCYARGKCNAPASDGRTKF